MTLKTQSPSHSELPGADMPLPAQRTPPGSAVLVGVSVTLCVLTGLLWVGRAFFMSGVRASPFQIATLLMFLCWMLLAPGLLGGYAWRLLRSGELHTRSKRKVYTRVGAVFGGALLMALRVWPGILDPDAWRDAQAGLGFIFLPIYGGLAAGIGLLVGGLVGRLLARRESLPEST